jgi:A/G-specific adenine glycosylase
VGGRFPDTVEGWLKVPGVGRYTAGAIVSIAFDKPAPILDGNVKRVLSRVFDIATPIEATATQQQLWALAEDLVPRVSPGAFNQAMMELGARICVPRSPLCGECPIRTACKARDLGAQEQRPVRRPVKPVPHYEVVVAVISRRGRFLLGRRPPDGLLGGLWEFPGGKVHPGETHKQALEREAREELGITIHVGEQIAVVQHAYSHFRVTLNVYRCAAPEGRPRAKAHTELRWIPRSKLSEYPLPGANHRFLHLL